MSAAKKKRNRKESTTINVFLGKQFKEAWDKFRKENGLTQGYAVKSALSSYMSKN